MTSSSSASSIHIGSYQLFERVGEGGSGQVYRGADASGRPVAVKLLSPHADLAQDDARARFEREIRLLAELDHPNLIRLLDHGVDPELGPYLVTPFVAGTTLRRLFAPGPVCPEVVLLVLEQVAAAVAALHQVGLVHRDLKPENLMGTPEGRVVVVDLGLALREGQTRYTGDEAVVGSVPYMAPEQIEGRPLDGAADVWALGVMAYEWLAGRRPFQRERPAEEAAAILVGSFGRLAALDRRVSAEVDRLVGACLQMRAAERPSAADLVQLVRAAIDWTDESTIETERVAALADPAGYLARVAPFRVRRVKRQAREAIDAGRPFVALAIIDRGLAYADDPELGALAEEAERASARAEPPMAERAVASTPGIPLAALPPAERVGAAPSRRGWLVGGAIAASVAAAFAVGFLARSEGAAPPIEAPAAPSPARTTTTVQNNADEQTLQMVGTMFSLFERGLAVQEEANRQRAAGLDVSPGAGSEPTTASGWVSRARSQAPAEALVSVGRALALEPGAAEAHRLRCALEVELEAAGAEASCTRAIEVDKGHAANYVHRGLARLRAGDAKQALFDLDRAVSLDGGNAEAFAARARVREAGGDRSGALRDLDSACALGAAAACERARP